MMGSARILCGTLRSCRVQQINLLARNQWGHVRLLVPTRQCAQQRLETLLLESDPPLPGAWGRPVLTMDDFATEILRSQHLDPVRVRDTERRLLLRQAITKCATAPAIQALGTASETPGFAAHVLRVIVQLKQAAIDPISFQHRLAQPGPGESISPLDEAVSVLYAAYQEALLEADLYDLPGLFWKATEILRQECPKPFRETTTLLLDGFDDFTPSEFRLLEAMAPYLHTLVFGLNYDVQGNRQDVYRIPARTAQQLREHFDAAIQVCEEPEPDSLTAFAAQHLFWRDTPPDGKAFLAHHPHRDLELLACPDPTQELEMLARRVKHLLMDQSVPPNQIALVFRNLGSIAPVLRSTFETFEIPVRLNTDRSLAESAISAFLVTLLDALEQWPRESMVDILSSPWLGWRSEQASAFRALARAAQIMSGFEEWRIRIESLSTRMANNRHDDSVAMAGRIPDAPLALKDLLTGIDRLRVIGQGIPAKGSLLDYALALEQLIQDLEIPRALEKTVPLAPAIRALEMQALQAWRTLLSTWRLWHERHPNHFTRNEFMALLRQILNETPLLIPGTPDAVSCLDVESARHLSFDYVFFGNCIEGSVPNPPTKNAIYGEDDIARLSRMGIQLDNRRIHGEREILLFHQMLNTARHLLCISWHTFTRDGREQYPSPYVRDLRELFPEGTITLPALRSNAFITELAGAASCRDLRNALFASAPSSPASALFPRAQTGVLLEQRRQRHAAFDEYDGVIQDTGLRAQIADQFGNAHAFSVNQVETYGTCPFHFFVERLLNIQLDDIPEAEFDARIRGSILHAVLHAFHARYRETAPCDIPEEEARIAMQDILHSLFENKAWRSVTAPRGITAVERIRMEKQLTRYLNLERDTIPSDRKPTHFEVAFGRAPEDYANTSADPLTRKEPFPLQTDNGTVLFAGRIDRIDRLPAKADGVARVCLVDYKNTLYITQADIKEGRSIQLGLYALAIEQHLIPGATVEEAVFLGVGTSKRTEALHREKNEWPDRANVVRQVVAASVEGIRAGRYAPTPTDDQCTNCPIADLAPGRACRYDKRRIAAKELPL